MDFSAFYVIFKNYPDIVIILLSLPSLLYYTVSGLTSKWRSSNFLKAERLVSHLYNEWNQSVSGSGHESPAPRVSGILAHKDRRIATAVQQADLPVLLRKKALSLDTKGSSGKSAGGDHPQWTLQPWERLDGLLRPSRPKDPPGSAKRRRA